MNHIPTFTQFLLESIFGDEYAMFEYEQKQIRKLQSSVNKVKLLKMKDYAKTLAESINDENEALKKARLAEHCFNDSNMIAEIFYKRAEKIRKKNAD